VSSILPKNELENVNFCPSLLGQNFFVRFFGRIEKNKKTLQNQLTFSRTFLKDSVIPIIFGSKVVIHPQKTKVLPDVCMEKF
jgi:hypothetical protein